jgi:hypothetical protein
MGGWDEMRARADIEANYLVKLIEHYVIYILPVGSLDIILPGNVLLVVRSCRTYRVTDVIFLLLFHGRITRIKI